MPFQPKQKVPIITNATPANVKPKKLWTKLKEEPNIQHQLWQLPMKYTRFRMIMLFSLQCRKKTTCCEQSLENDKKRYVFKHLPQLTDILTSLMSLLPSSAGIMDCRRILVVLRRIFGCSYGTWKKVRKCIGLSMFKKLPDYCAPSAPDAKKWKTDAKYPKHLWVRKCCAISQQ